jgi:hypothetical protein
MEDTLIVLIDTEARKICLYGTYNREFMLDEFHVLKAFLKDSNVLYVRAADEISGDEAVETAAAILEQLPPVEPVKRYFRVNTDGYTHIPELHLRFAGPKDFKPVSDFAQDIFDRSPTLTKLLKSGKLEILTEEEVEKLKKPKPRPQSQSIILEKPVRDKDGNFVFENDTIFTEDNEITEQTKIETDEEDALRQGFGRTEE